VDADKAAARDYSVAFAFQKKKLYVPAAARWAKYIQAYPKDKRLASAHLNLGVCQFGQKTFDIAAKTFRAILQKYPQFQQRDRAQFNLGMSHYNIAIGFDAVAVKSQAVADQQKAATEFKKAAAEFALLPKQYAKSGSIADATYYQAECLFLAGDKKAAIPVYQQVVAKFASSPFAADALYGLGTTQAELEQHAEAATSFQQFIAKFPKDERTNECRLRHGMALYSQDKFADAEKVFAQAAAVKDSPYADFALLRQAQSLQAQDKLPNAATIYESLPTKFKTSPYTGAALLGAGKCRFRAEQFPQAQKSFQAIVTQKLPEAAEAAYLLGRTLIQLKKPAKAVPVLNAAITAYPASEFLPDLNFTRIDALYEQPKQRPQTAKLYADFSQKYAKHTRAAESLYRATFVAWEAEGYTAARQYATTFLANPEFVKHELK
ncbi:MAG: tetratricopeptide repeat protein, partial [Boseongicola sp.]